MSETGPPSVDENAAASGHEQRPGMPLWVKVAIGVVVAFVALFLVLKALGVDGGHGPGRHGASAPLDGGGGLTAGAVVGALASR